MLSVISLIAFGGVMASITIRNLDDNLKARLRIEAASHGHSMEEEARLIIRRAMTQSDLRGGIGSRIHARFAQAGGADLEIPSRNDKPRAADFAE
jgi:plasmid stability protein